ncbi:DMT family transporter [Alphaproteobacteria bacterium]|jgi:drug/metabolite transporter (DMT)-like permease|nr:DMT family transporter [Alphaproteobacteria bacterium]|tara:strand:- start:12567 stop:13436 length:870 start_codon:yes stop_codon:yes gene_type:complete
MLKLKNKTIGILFIISAVLCFSIMNGITRYLSEFYNVITLNMFRYWFFAVFLFFIHSNKNKSIVIVSKSKNRILQTFRGSMLAIQMCFAHYCFLKLGLIETSAIFAVGPLMVTALSIIFLNEKVGWQRLAAIAFGFIGIIIILRPGMKVFDPLSVLALGCALSYAIYQILTRFVSTFDTSETSFFYTGITGALILSFVGPFFYIDVLKSDWILILMICFLGTSAHYFVIKAYHYSEASLLQPFNYLQLVVVSLIGMIFFNETLEIPVLIGSLMVVSAGLFTFWRSGLQK